MFAFISSPTARDGAGLRMAFAKAGLLYWTSVFPRVRAHIERWERRAERIPDAQLRRLALAALQEKRANIEGAAAFAALVPRARRAQAALALSSFQAAYNLLDMLGEQHSPDPVSDGRRLHEALLYALQDDPRAQPLDWYEHHPRREDGGHLDRLLREARGAISSLPAYGLVAPRARAAAARIVAFQSLNLSESQGDHSALEQWAHAATPAGSELRWWETAAAAGSSLAVYALLAAAANPSLEERQVDALERAYFPWIGVVHSLLDNLIDKHEDEAAGHRSLVEYYGPQRAALRLRWLTEQAMRATAALPEPDGHTAILVAMIGSYLSDPQARTAELAPIRQAVLDASGPLVKPTLAVFALRAHLSRLAEAVRGPRALLGRFRRWTDGTPRDVVSMRERAWTRSGSPSARSEPSTRSEPSRHGGSPSARSGPFTRSGPSRHGGSPSARSGPFTRSGPSSTRGDPPSARLDNFG